MRCLSVWCTISVAVGVAGRLSLGPASHLLRGRADLESFPALLVQVSSVALLCTTAWWWLVTTTTVWACLRGRRPALSGHASRLVLALCGAALGAGALSPAAAQSGPADGIGGLQLPDRVHAGVRHAPPTAPADGRTSPAPTRRATPPPGTAGGAPDQAVHVVVAGDSLWGIARATSPPGTDLDEVWRAIWHTNREVVGADPDLIRPGQRLAVPPSAPTAAPVPPDATEESTP